MAKLTYALKGETVAYFYVEDASFDAAYSAAVATAIEKGMTIVTSDKNGGTLYAQYPGTAFGGEITTLNLLLAKESDSRLKCTLSVKSSRRNQAAIDDFKSVFAKKVKISDY